MSAAALGILFCLLCQTTATHAACVTCPARRLDSWNILAMVKNVFIILLAGVAVLGGLVLVTLGFTYLMDRFCSSDQVDLMDQSRLTRKAGLYGLTRWERMQVMEHLLTKTTRTFCAHEDEEAPRLADSEADIAVDMTMDDRTLDDQTETTTEDQVPKDEDEADEAEVAGVLESDKDQDNEEVPESAQFDDADHKRTCCICLEAYTNGCQVLTGTQCQHLFHSVCALEWLRTHDGCPYCRVDMVHTEEFRVGAEEILGQERCGFLGRYERELALLRLAQDDDAAVRVSVTETAVQDGETIPANADERVARTDSTPPVSAADQETAEETSAVENAPDEEIGQT